MTQSKKMVHYFMIVHEAINHGSNHPEISEMLSRYGFDPKRIYKGELLYEKTYALYQKQQKSYQKKTLLKKQLDDLWKSLKIEHQKLYYIGQILSAENPETGIKLGLNNNRKESFAGKMAQMDLFHKTLLESTELIQLYAAYGITEEKILAIKDLQEKVIDFKESYHAVKSEAQQATEDKNKSMHQLKEWMSEYRGIARYALKKKPQYLEKLGILVRSKPMVS